MSNSPLMRAPEVLELTQVSHSTIRRWMEKGEFPKQVQLGGSVGRAIGWHRAEVMEWLDSRQPVSTKSAA